MAVKRKSSVWPKIVILLLLAGGIAYGYTKYRAKSGASGAVELRTNVVSRGDIVQAVTANGQLSPNKSVQVGSQVSGIIQKLYVDFNSKVTNGQVVAQIDPQTYEQNLSSSEAELENAKAALLFAELNYKRAEDLKKSDLIALSEHDKTVVDLSQARAIVRMREASLRRAQVDLERTTIYAPIDGVVISRAVDEGQTVAASLNAPTLFLLANDLRQMRIEALVSEADVGGIAEGQSVNFTVDAFPNRQFRGVVSQLRFAPITNQNVVNYTAIVDVQNEDLKLRPGMTAIASIITAEKRGALRVPNAALRFRPPEDMLPKTATNTAAASGATNSSAGSGDTAGAPGGGGDRREEMRRRMESMSPEEREAMRQRFAGGGGRGGGAGGGPMGAPRERAPEGPVTRTLYVVDKPASAPGKPILKPVSVKLGVSDGNNTEVIEGLSEGDVIVTAVSSPAMAGAAATPQGGSPFGSPFGRGPGGGGGPGGGRGPR